MSLFDKINDVPEPEPNNAWLWMLGGLVVVGIIVFVVMTRLDTQEVPLDTPSQPIPKEYSPSEENNL